MRRFPRILSALALALYWILVAAAVLFVMFFAVKGANAQHIEAVDHPLPIVEQWRPPTGYQLTEAEMVQLIDVYFPDRWHDWALKVSRCESGWLTNAKNPRSSAAGLFQFLRSTWDWVAGETGTPTYDQGGVWEVHSQMINASWLVQNGGPSHWSPSQHCWG